MVSIGYKATFALFFLFFIMMAVFIAAAVTPKEIPSYNNTIVFNGTNVTDWVTPQGVDYIQLTIAAGGGRDINLVVPPEPVYIEKVYNPYHNTTHFNVYMSDNQNQTNLNFTELKQVLTDYNKITPIGSISVTDITVNYRNWELPVWYPVSLDDILNSESWDTVH